MKNSFFIKLLAVMTFLFVSLFTVEVKAIDYTSGKYSVGGIFYGDTLGEEITYMNMAKDGTIYDAFCLNHEYKYCRNSKTYTSIANSSYEAKGLGSLVAYFYESCGRSNGTTTGLSCENWAQYAIWEIITYYTNNGKIPPSGTTLSSSLSTAHNGNETTFMEKISAINEEYLKIASPSNYCITITAPNGNTKDFCMKYETSDSYYKCDGSIDILKYNDTGTCEGSVTSSYYQLMATYNGSCTKNPKTGGLKIVKKSESGKLRLRPNPAYSNIHRTFRRNRNTSRYRTGSRATHVLQGDGGKLAAIQNHAASAFILGDGNTAGVDTADAVLQVVHLHMGVAGEHNGAGGQDCRQGQVTVGAI